LDELRKTVPVVETRVEELKKNIAEQDTDISNTSSEIEDIFRQTGVLQTKYKIHQQ